METCQLWWHTLENLKFDDRFHYLNYHLYTSWKTRDHHHWQSVKNCLGQCSFKVIDHRARGVLDYHRNQRKCRRRAIEFKKVRYDKKSTDWEWYLCYIMAADKTCREAYNNYLRATNTTEYASNRLHEQRTEAFSWRSVSRAYKGSRPIPIRLY